MSKLTDMLVARLHSSKRYDGRGLRMADWVDVERMQEFVDDYGVFVVLDSIACVCTARGKAIASESADGDDCGEAESLDVLAERVAMLCEQAKQDHIDRWKD